MTSYKSMKMASTYMSELLVVNYLEVRSKELLLLELS
jgi:hypothetical protein